MKMVLVRLAPAQGGPGDPLRQYSAHHVAIDIGKAEVAAGVAVGELFVV